MNYDRINWENSPSKETPLDADNLNKMDVAIDTLNREVSRTRSDVSDHEEQLDALSSQMSTFVRLEDGSTTGDAELANGRVGYDGTEFDSIGNAIRGQVRGLKNHLVEVSETEPEESYNKIWIKDDDEEIEIPTMADLEAVSGEVDELNERLGIAESKIDDIVPGLTDTAKVALLNCFANVSWNNNGKVYYDALVAALYDSYPRISATYNPGVNVIYTDDTLDTLKQYITVKYYATSESEGVVIGSNSYTLSGTLAEGTNNITVTYDELTTTVIVPDVIDFYNIWEWDSRFTGAGKLTRTPVRAGEFTYEGVSRKGILYNTSLISGNNNRGFATLRGKAPMVTEDNVTLSNYYPIPIPATATKLTATITPNTQRLSPVLFQYDPTNQTPAPYSRTGSIAWHVGTQTVTFTASENLFLAFNCSIDSAFTRYTPETEPEMNVVFE